MEYRYYRELKRNYLIFEDKRSEDGEDKYQYKIAESGRIKGLVPCTERSINGEQFFYYEIGSMQTLRDRFTVSGMDYSQLKRLLTDIKSLLENLSEFLMGDEGLVFNSRSIYTDLTTGENKLIFCPFFDEQKSFSEFAMELLELVDEKDEKATDLAYKLCDKSAGRDDFLYEVIENALEGADTCEEEKAASTPIVNDSYLTEKEEPEDDPEDDEEVLPKRSQKLKRADKKMGGKLQLLFSLLFLCVVAGMVYVRMNFILSKEENILSILVMLVSAITGMVALFGGIREVKGTKVHADQIPEEDEDENGYEDDFAEDDRFDYPSEEMITSYKKPIKVTGSFNMQKEDFDCGETMVLDEDTGSELSLFSRNLDKTVRIALGSLPLTIGKMEGCVDKVLKDKSISRIHCRLINEDGRICILDLGSTNGTYRNGIKLNPQEKTFIEEGDEIRIGRVCFDCR